MYLDPSCPVEYQSIPYHTGCLATSKYVTKVGLTDANKINIVKLHNRWRSNLAVPASSMLKMVTSYTKQYNGILKQLKFEVLE